MTTPTSAGPATTTASARSGSGRRAGWVLALSSLGSFVVLLDTTIVNVAFETISRSFHTSTDHLSWILNAYSLVFAAMLIPAGRLADRYGRKRVFLIGMSGFAVMSCVCGIAPDISVLIAGRALQAAFAALATPASLALILPEFPPERRPVAIGAWSSMGALAAAVGPTAGALLTQYADWRWIFLVNVPICLVVVVVGVRLLHEGRNEQAEGLPDPIGVALIAAVPAALSLAVVEGPAWGWSDPRVVGGFVAAALLLPVFILRTRSARHPVVHLELFANRDFRLVNAATLLFAAAFYGTLLSNIVFLQTQWHYSVLRAALATAPGPVVVALLARTSSRLAHKHGARSVLTLGAVTYTAGLALFIWSSGTDPHWLTHWLPASILTGLGTGMTLPVQSSTAARSLPAAHFAVGSGINASFRQLGAVLGVSLFVAIAGSTAGGTAGSFHRTWEVFAALSLVAGAVLWAPRWGRGRTGGEPGGRAEAPDQVQVPAQR